MRASVGSPQSTRRAGFEPGRTGDACHDSRTISGTLRRAANRCRHVRYFEASTGRLASKKLSWLLRLQRMTDLCLVCAESVRLRRMPTKHRRRPAPGSNLDTPELAALSNYIRERKCVLFVGAGLSRDAGLPDWRRLMRTILDKTKSESATPEAAGELEALFDRGKYIELADQCRELLSPGYFHAILRQLLGGPVQPTDLHRAIVETPYACIVTTNFDTLL